jgi:hypothetical protein
VTSHGQTGALASLMRAHAIVKLAGRESESVALRLPRRLHRARETELAGQDRQ